MASRPVLARCHFALGAFFAWWGGTAAAVHAYRDALRADPAFAEALARLGEALGRQRRWREASQALRQAVRLAPDDDEGRASLICVYARAGQLQRAAGELLALTRLRPGDAEVRLLLAAVLGRLHRAPEAIRVLREATGLRTLPHGTRFVLGEALLGEAAWAGLVGAHGAAVQLPPANAQGWGDSRFFLRPRAVIRTVPTMPAAPTRLVGQASLIWGRLLARWQPEAAIRSLRRGVRLTGPVGPARR